MSLRSKLVVVTGAFLGICVLDAASVSVFSSGITGYSGKQGQTCSQCHGGGITPTTVIEGPLYVTVSTTKNYLLRISGGQQTAAGFNVAVERGTLSTVESGTKLVGTEITHSTPRLVDPNFEVIFKYAWTGAVVPRTVQMWGAGNSVNLTGGTSGDQVDTDLIVINVVAAAVNFYKHGDGFAGSGGLVPDLDGKDGDATLGTYQLRIGDGLGGAFGVLFGGLGAANFQWYGANFFVDLTQPFFMIPFALQGTPGVGGSGFIDFQSLALDVFAGSSFYLQALIDDPGAAFGVAFTDALRMDVGL